MERTSRLAIAGSLLWVALATGIILGTQSRAVTASDAPAAMPDRASAEWHAYPASGDAPAGEIGFRQC